jgi:hypothetical protein
MKSLLVTVLLLGSGCVSADSNRVPTDQIAAELQVTADGSGQTIAHGWLWTHRAGDPPLNETSIELVDGDRLVASSSGSSLAMQETEILNAYGYDAIFDSDGAGQSFQIALMRDSDASAPSSSVTLPAPFTVTVPTTFARSAPLTVTWTSSGSADEMRFRFVGACVDAELGPVADTGQATFPAGAVTAKAGGPASCMLSLEASRSRSGSLDPAYGQGGAITATQQRTVTLTATP